MGAKVGMTGMRLIMRLILAVRPFGLSQIGQIIRDIPIGRATHTGQWDPDRAARTSALGRK